MSRTAKNSTGGEKEASIPSWRPWRHPRTPSSRHPTTVSWNAPRTYHTNPASAPILIFGNDACQPCNRLHSERRARLRPPSYHLPNAPAPTGRSTHHPVPARACEPVGCERRPGRLPRQAHAHLPHAFGCRQRRRACVRGRERGCCGGYGDWRGCRRLAEGGLGDYGKTASGNVGHTSERGTAGRDTGGERYGGIQGCPRRDIDGAWLAIAFSTLKQD